MFWAGTALWSLAQDAAALEAVRGKVVLTVSGQIGLTNHEGVAAFDMSMLQALPQRTLVTRTPWDPRVVRFSGPLLRDLLAVVKAQGREIQAIAQNDYTVSIPMEDIQQHDVLLALRLNDQPISPRTKGPLYIMYPFSQEPALDVRKYHRRAIWQLQAVRVL